MVHCSEERFPAELGTARKELRFFQSLPLHLLIGISTNATMGCRNTGSLGNPSHALAFLVREVIWDSLIQSYRAGQASWLKHTNHTTSVLLNERQRCLFVPERDCGWWEGTGTSIHPGLYQQPLTPPWG